MIGKAIFLTTLLCSRDKERVFQALGKELSRRLPNGRRCSGAFVDELRALPVGLRAMAATYELDVSVTLDDLGWHFGNWHNKALAALTHEGLLELGLVRHADVFSTAYHEVELVWELYENDLRSWYDGSVLEQALTPLNAEMWKINKGAGNILAAWAPYAKANIRRCM